MKILKINVDGVMTMKNFGMVLLVLVFAVMVALSGISFASVNPKIQLQSYSVSKVPAEAGDVLNVTIHLKSLEWDNCAGRVSVQISTTYPLSVQGPDTQYVDSLCYGDPDSTGTFSFLIPIDPLAQSGTYQVSLVTTYEKRYSVFNEANTLNIRVGGAPSFTASVTSSNPIDIYPGDNGAITITFQNNGSSMVKSARVAIEASPGIEVKWSGKNQEIGQINAHGSAAATFNIQPNKDLAPGTYKLSAKLNYIGEDNKNGTSEFTFDLPIKPKAEFSAHAARTEALLAEQNENVNITIKNIGYQEARKLKVQIKPIFPFSTDGTVRYVDSLAPGEEQNVTYTIHVDKEASAGTQLLSVLVDFEDPQGKKMSDSADFSLLVRQKTIMDRVLDLWYVWVILGLVIVMNVVRRITKKK
ncbi:hypothetical protein HY988_02740 [Candidatus Micrarchaeota archaeon]|nr:hypothetical protein [Candidatus Micrarchaeota archaeon]